MKIIPIPHFYGYFAGENGHIYSNHGRGAQKIPQPLRKLKPNIQSSGKYFYVNVKKDNKRITQRVHRLVCLAFHGFPPNTKYAASHLDGNWRNNTPSNLKWESYSDNANRKKEHGTDDIGVKNSRAIIDLKTLVKIRKLLKNSLLTHKEIGVKFGVNRVFITKIANGHRYKNQGCSNVYL